MCVLRHKKGVSNKVALRGVRLPPALPPEGLVLAVWGDPPAVGGDTAGEACRLVLLALREEATLAIETIAAGYVMETHHTVARDPLRYAAAHCYDRAGYFMAQNLRRRNVGVINLLDVGAADAASGDFDEHFAIAHFWDGDFLDANDSLSAVDTGAHRFRDGTKRLQMFEGCSGPAHRVATCLASWSTTSAVKARMKPSRKELSFRAALRLCV